MNSDDQIIIYRDKNGEAKVDVKMHDETVWLSLNLVKLTKI